ncbi:unnamed protein product [Protopolystoma xenopodis]|uniref:Uncharacterized protein n=1 Tax=Protopolystoma xenopodis TaxID=117903 RepID=A0A3S5FDG5_9PLAT|nr:unnamed protein product [Protopolystoma xenopodis]
MCAPTECGEDVNTDQFASQSRHWGLTPFFDPIPPLGIAAKNVNLLQLSAHVAACVWTGAERRTYTRIYSISRLTGWTTVYLIHHLFVVGLPTWMASEGRRVGRKVGKSGGDDGPPVAKWHRSVTGWPDWLFSSSRPASNMRSDSERQLAPISAGDSPRLEDVESPNSDEHSANWANACWVSDRLMILSGTRLNDLPTRGRARLPNGQEQSSVSGDRCLHGSTSLWAFCMSGDTKLSELGQFAVGT